MELRLQDQSGVGSIELVDAHSRLTRWRYTLSHHAEALALAAAWQALRHPDPQTARSEI
jgi:ATP-binding cassette subfamily B protein